LTWFDVASTSTIGWAVSSAWRNVASITSGWAEHTDVTPTVPRFMPQHDISNQFHFGSLPAPR
jgi:hypothetical protein